MHDDRPLIDPSADKLGFDDIAAHLTRAIMGDTLTSGFVFGIEGAWGSGKSSLINLTLEHLQANSTKPESIEFRPWLVGKREDLFKELFGQISAVIHKVLDGPDALDARRLLKIYTHVASQLAGVAEVAELLEIPLAGKAKTALRSTGRVAGGLAEQPLAALKDELKTKLNQAKKRIVIVIDDLDRLDPEEVVEVLRLVRAVADFPNVVYVLAYDPGRIASQLKKALRIHDHDSATYMEKIVQVSVSVPTPMSFDLVNWFRDEAAELLAVDIGIDRNKYQRFEAAVQTWAPLCVTTPRDVVRALNAIRLHAVPVKDAIDPGDMVALQLIRIKHPVLFQWVEDYVSTLARWGDDSMLARGAPKEGAANLLEIIGQSFVQKTRFTQALSQLLPGITPLYQEQDENDYTVYPQSWSDAERRPYSREKRLASVDHFRFYFAFSHPAGRLSDQAVEDFIAAARENKDTALEGFTTLAEERRPQGGVLAEVLVSEIVARRDQLDPDTILAIFDVLGRGMDILARNGRSSGGYPSFLAGDKTSIFGLIQQLDVPQRRTALKNLFTGSSSYAWLSGIIRDTTFEHGRYGNRAKPVEERLLNVDEWDMIERLYLDRIHNEKPETLLQTPYFLNVLFSWSQLGKEREVRQWIALQSETDEGFLNLLERMGNTPRSLGKDHYDLKPTDLQEFFENLHAMESRLAGLLDHQDPEIQTRAITLHQALGDGKNIHHIFMT